MKRKGFTYMEMIITMLIIIALSLISYPIYTGRKNSIKPALAEGYALLGYIVNAQIAYYNEYGNFLSHGHGWQNSSGSYINWNGVNCFTASDPFLGINAINNRYFSYFNAFGNNVGANQPSEYKYHFTAIVKSGKHGTISLEYNLTQRCEPVVEGI